MDSRHCLWHIYIALVFALFILTGCGGSGSNTKVDPTDSADTPETIPTPTPALGPEPLTRDAYNELSPSHQYLVANRLLSALFKGMPANRFFAPESISSAANTLKLSAEGADYLAKTRTALAAPLTNKNEIVTRIEGDVDLNIAAKYTFDSNRPLQYPLAYLYETPLSDDYFARWMAYKLANTIMFSPAEGIDSVDPLDVQSLYENLVIALKYDKPIRSIIFTHEKSESNWRRFRSPEDNTREMIEIFLGLFNRDADVPKASKTCKNWSLSDEDAGYQLIIEPSENTEPQVILDTYSVTTCDEFYAVVANHPLLIPRVTTVLVEHMFGEEYDATKRAALVRDIAAINPATFKELFLAILFSKEFLLNVERPKWFEESYYNVAERVYWRPYAAFFRDLNTNRSNANINASLPQMYQPAFSLKLGRPPTVPSDVLASAYQHNGLRSALLVRSNAQLMNDPSFDPSVIPSTGWGPELTAEVSTLSMDDFIGYMFISVLGRAPNADEASTLKQVINSARTPAASTTADCTIPNSSTNNTSGCLLLFTTSNTANRAMVVMDYLSRLPELYFFNAV